MFKHRIQAFIAAAIILGSQVAIANDFEKFINKPLEKELVRQSKLIELARLNFVKNTWTTDARGKPTANVVLIEAKSKIKCYYQLSHQSSDKEGAILRFSAKLSMPLNKKGEPKKPSNVEHCQNMAAIENISLYAIHKKIMGVEVNFSDLDTYQALWCRAKAAPKRFLSDDVKAPLAKHFGIPIIPATAFGRRVHGAHWSSESLTYSFENNFSGIKLLAAEGLIFDKDNNFSGELLVDHEGKSCSVLLTQKEIFDQGQHLSMLADVYVRTRADGSQQYAEDTLCQQKLRLLNQVDLYAISEDKMGIQLGFSDGNWIRTLQTKRIDGPSLQIKDARKAASFARLFNPENRVNKPIKADTIKKQQSSLAQFLTSEKWERHPWDALSIGYRGTTIKGDGFAVYANTQGSKKHRMRQRDSFYLSVEHIQSKAKIEYFGNCSSWYSLDFVGYGSNTIKVSRDEKTGVKKYEPTELTRAFYQSEKITDLLHLSETLDVTKLALEKFCGQVKSLRVQVYLWAFTDFRKGQNAEFGFNSRLPLIIGTYSQANNWQLIPGYTASNNIGGFILELKELFGRFQLIHIGDCRKEIELHIETLDTHAILPTSTNQSNMQNAQLTMPLIEQLVKEQCPSVLAITILFTTPPSGYQCIGTCKVSMSAEQQWEADWSQFEEIYYFSGYHDVIDAFEKGEFKKVKSTDNYLAIFYVEFFNQYSKQCGTTVNNATTIKVNWTRITTQDGFEISRESLGSPDYVSIDRRFAAHYAQLMDGRYSAAMKLSFIWKLLKGQSPENVVMGYLNNINKIESYLAKNGCQSPKTRAVLDNMDKVLN